MVTVNTLILMSVGCLLLWASFAPATYKCSLAKELKGCCVEVNEVLLDRLDRTISICLHACVTALICIKKTFILSTLNIYLQ